MKNSKPFAELVTDIYTTAVGPSGWRSMAARMAQAIGAHSCQIGIWCPQPGSSRRLSWTDNYTAELNQAYQTRYHSQDPWVAWLHRIPQGSLVTGNAMTISPGFTQTEIYEDYCRRLGIFHVLGAGIERKPDGAFNLIGVHREQRYGEFSLQQRHRLVALLPHLQQATALCESLGRLNLQRRALISALEALHMGVLIVDQNGALLFADSSAEEALRGQTQLTIRHGRVHLADTGLLSTLQKFIGEAAGAGRDGAGGAGGLLTVRTGAAQTLWLRVCPLPGSVFAESIAVPGAFIFLRRTESEHIPLQDGLIRLYGLTRAEARLAEAIVHGLQLTEYRVQAGVSLNTAKTLIKRIYAKTGHHSRGQFIRDVLSNPFLEMETASRSRH